MFPKAIQPLFIGCLALMAAAQPSHAGDKFAQADARGGWISFYLQSPPAQVMLTVSGPDFYLHQDFAPGDAVSLQLVDESGQPLPEGIYKYELRTQPATDETALADAELAGDNRLLLALWEDSRKQSQVQSGSFEIINGQIVIDATKKRHN
jgi:hypothetical protein